VFLDEKENSSDNNALGVYWFDLVSRAFGHFLAAARQRNGCVLSFAAGHVEFWKWRRPNILNALGKNAAGNFDFPNDPDVLRLAETVPRTVP
jgi:hypothetical protein